MCLLLAVAPSLMAVVVPEPFEYTWDSGDNSSLWERAANWVGDVTPPSSPTTAVKFGTGAQTQVNVADTRVLTRVLFAETAESFTLQLGRLSFESAFEDIRPMIVQSSAKAQVIESAITLKTGLTVEVSGAGSLLLSGAVQGSGPLHKDGAGGTLILAGNNAAFTGDVSVNQGTARVAHSTALGDTAGKTTVVAGAALAIGSLNAGLPVNVPEPISIAGFGANTTGAINNAANTNTLSGPITLDANARIQASAGTLQLTGGISGDGRSLHVGGDGHVAISSSIATGSGGLVKDGKGTLTLGAVNTYAGSTTLLEGKILLQASQVFNDTSGITISQGSILDLNGFSETVGNIGGSGTLQFGGAVLTLAEGTSSFGGVFSGPGTLVVGPGAVLNLEAAFNAPTLNIVLNGGSLLLGNGQKHQFGSLEITGQSLLDFGTGGATSVSFNSLSGNGSDILTVQNWANAVDHFFVQNNPAPQGVPPTNQVDFMGSPVDSWTGDDTKWVAFANTTYGELTPVPEPSTYGALLLGSLSLLVVYRRRRAAKHSAA